METLRSKANEADALIAAPNTTETQADAAHEWLHDLQDWLENAVDGADDLCTSCPV